MQLADAVDPLGQPHAHHGHVEHGRVAAGERLRAQGQHPVSRQRRVGGGPAEVPLYEVAAEPVDPGRHRRVRGEHRAGPAQLDGLLEGEALLGVLPDALHAEEAGVSLVGVEDLRLSMAGERAERPDRPDSAHAEEQFLPQPVIAAAAVEPVGDLAQRGLVLFHVGVEQQQRHPADLGHPDLRGQQLALGQGDADPHGGPVGGAEQGERQPVRVTGRVTLRLPALGRQGLGEVPVPVQQAYPDERHPQVAAGLEMITGQDAEAAGVLGQRLGDPVLRGEVGDRGGRPGRARQGRYRRLRVPLVPPRPGQVLVQVTGRVVEPPQERLIVAQALELGRRHLAEQRDRVVPGRLPAGRIDRREEVAGLGMPGPAEVQREVTQRGEGLRQRGTDGKAADGSHGRVLVSIGR